MNIQTKCCICEQWNIVQPLKKGNLDTSYSIDEAWRHAKWESQPPMRSTVWFRLYDVPAAAKLLQSFLTLCDPVDSSPPGCPVPGILQARTLGVGCRFLLQCVKVKSESEVAQSCRTLSDPMDCSLPGSSAHGIFQTRVLEWVAIAFSW